MTQSPQNALGTTFGSCEPYDGSDPFAFASYARADSYFVYPEIATLGAAGNRIWYDKGIPGGADWTELLTQRLVESSVLLMFLTKNSVRSKQVLREVIMASTRNKPIIPVHFEKLTLPTDMEYHICSHQYLYKYEMSPDLYADELQKALDKYLTQPAEDDAPVQGARLKRNSAITLDRLLVRACLEGLKAEAGGLLKEGAGVNAYIDGLTPLNAAIFSDRFDVAQLLLSNGALPNGRREEAPSPLTLAAAKGDTRTITLLLQSGADPNRRDVDSGFPLMQAALCGNVDAVRTLLDFGADPLLTDDKGETAQDALGTKQGTKNCPEILSLLSSHRRQA